MASSTPSIAARGDFVVVAWSASDASGAADVYVATSPDAGATFSSPVRVNATRGAARVGGELPPRVALAAGSAGTTSDIVVVWGERRGKSVALLLARSHDAGQTFEPPLELQKTGAPGDRGWHAVAVDEAGAAHVIWLDHRGLAQPDDGRPAHRHGAHKAGATTLTADAAAAAVAMAGKSALYHRSDGDGSVELEVASSVCYCCKTALAAGRDHRLYAAWRAVYPGSIRDIAAATSEDDGRSFSEPHRVSQDNWQIAGCPDDGPAVALDASDVVHIVWPTLVDGAEPVAALFYATSRDGRVYSPRVRIPTLGGSKPTHPQIAVAADGTTVLAWDEVPPGGVRTAAVSVVATENGQPIPGRAIPLNDGQAASYPVLARTTRGVLAAWTSGPPSSSTIALATLDSNGRVRQAARQSSR
jgi:hypothetical protein